MSHLYGLNNICGETEKDFLKAEFFPPLASNVGTYKSWTRRYFGNNSAVGSATLQSPRAVSYKNPVDDAL